MKLTGADRRILGVLMAAGAVMLLCFSSGRAAMRAMEPLPYEPPAAVERSGERLVDINTAGLDELTALPGIGEARARAILDDREANGPYRYPEDLIRVKGIGEGILSELMDQITTRGDQDAEDISGR